MQHQQRSTRSSQAPLLASCIVFPGWRTRKDVTQKMSKVSIFSLVSNHVPSRVRIIYSLLVDILSRPLPPPDIHDDAMMDILTSTSSMQQMRQVEAAMRLRE